MRSTRRLRWMWVACGAGLLALACGGEEAPPADARPPGPITLENPPRATTPEEESVSKRSAAETCIVMATREDWARALDPCARAAREHPDDPTIQRALERALEAENAAIDDQ